MNEVVILSGSLTSVAGLLVWLVKSVIGEYQKRLKGHDEFLENLFAEQKAGHALDLEMAKIRAESHLELAKQMTELSNSVRGVSEAVIRNSEIVSLCEEAESIRMRRRIREQQAAMADKQP